MAISRSLISFPNRVLATFCLGALLLTAFDAEADWQLVWSDEFNGTSLNTNTWALGNIWNLPNCPGWGNTLFMSYTNDVSHSTVSNGYVAIKATATLQGTNNYYIASARMVSIGFDQCSAELFPESNPVTVNGGASVEYPNGGTAVEFRARVPVGTGLWPAVWMLPVPDGGGDPNWTSPIYGAWPVSGEVDILETSGGNGGFNSNVIDSAGNHYVWNPVSDVTQWHVYRLNWLTNQMQFVVDGVTNGTFSSWTPPPGFSYPAPFNIPFFITINLAVGGAYVGNPTPAQCAASLPAELDIDYVRIYQQVNPLLSLTRTNRNIVLSWLSQPAPWILQQATSPGGPWALVPIAKYQTNQNTIFFNVQQPFTNSMFYRLEEQ